MALERKMTEPEYRQLEAISYSKLSGVDKTPASLLNHEPLDTPSITYGSAVDVLAFDGEEEFNSKFLINSGATATKVVEKTVSDLMKVVIEEKGELIGKIDDYDKRLLGIARANEYGAPNWKDETIIRKLKDEGGRELWDFEKIKNGRKILDTLQWQNVRNSVHVLYTHDFTSKWFTANEDEELYFQLPVIWKYKGVDCKSLFDIIKIDHKNKIIYPVDLKTSYDHVLAFPSNFIKWKYYIQSAFYTEAVRYLKLEHKELFDYRIDNFRFVIISSQDPFRPLVYKTTDEDLYAGKHGGYIKKWDDNVRGFDQLIDDMNWHLQNNLYDYPKYVYESGGELSLNVF